MSKVDTRQCAVAAVAATTIISCSAALYFVYRNNTASSGDQQQQQKKKNTTHTHTDIKKTMATQPINQEAQDQQQAFMSITGLYVYPVKSMRGLSVTTFRFDDLGPENDRRFCVINADAGGTPVTQRENRRLATIQPHLEEEEDQRCNDDDEEKKTKKKKTLRFSLPVAADGGGGPDDNSPIVPLDDDDDDDAGNNNDGNENSSSKTTRTIEVWGAPIQSLDCGDDIAGWLTTQLNKGKKMAVAYRLVQLAPGAFRDSNKYDNIQQPFGNTVYGKEDVSSYSDCSQYTMTFTKSCEYLEACLKEGQIENIETRFRPNIVVASHVPFQEDWISRMRVETTTSVSESNKNDDDDDNHQQQLMPIELKANKGIHRCTMCTVSQQTGERDAQMEPLKLLREFRLSSDDRYGAAPFFGLNVSHVMHHDDATPGPDPRETVKSSGGEQKKQTNKPTKYRAFHVGDRVVVTEQVALSLVDRDNVQAGQG